MQEKVYQKSFLPIVGWCFYDWACTAYSIIVVTFIFSTYFTTQVAANKILGTYQWGCATAIAGLMIAFFSPLFGAIADHGGNHKRWLLSFTLLAIIGSALFWFVYPAPQYVYLALGAFILGSIGYEIAQVFYNAFLPYLSSKTNLGRISGIGWGAGYLGGIVSLSIALFIFVKKDFFGLGASSAGQIRICGPFVALWMGLFSLPLLFWVPNIPSPSRPMMQAIKMGWRELVSTIKKLPQEKNILLYLISHMIYTDGLNTLFAFGGIYAAGVYGFSFEEVLLFGITMNITAGIGAIALGWMDDYVGSKKTVLISLAFLTGLGLIILFLHDKYIFWAISLILSIFIGPVQSASRSLMVHLIVHKETSAEMFGLYALSGRITAFIGPWLLGEMTYIFDNQRVGMATIMLFFITGALLLLPIKDAAPCEGQACPGTFKEGHKVTA